MIQFTEVLADAYVRPARNVAMPSQPGRQVKFLQGHAAIKDGRDLAAMLRRPDVLLVLTDYALSWIEEIERAAGQIRAEVRRPEREKAPQTGGTASGASTAPAGELEPSIAEHIPPGRAWQVPGQKGHNPFADYPRDPTTGRIMKREHLGADSPDPDS